METVVLGSTGIKVNKNGFGALPIQRVSTEDAVKLARKAYEAGITFFDTARFYTDSEEKLGEAFDGMREKVYIATKTAAKNADTAKTAAQNAQKAAEKSAGNAANSESAAKTSAEQAAAARDTAQELAGRVIVDDALSDTSASPVQNKVIFAALAKKQDVQRVTFVINDTDGGLDAVVAD